MATLVTGWKGLRIETSLTFAALVRLFPLILYTSVRIAEAPVHSGR